MLAELRRRGYRAGALHAPHVSSNSCVSAITFRFYSLDIGLTVIGGCQRIEPAAHRSLTFRTFLLCPALSVFKGDVCPLQKLTYRSTSVLIREWLE